MKYLVWIVIFVVVVGGGVAYLYSRDKAAVTAGANTQQTAKVVRRDVEKIVSANGKVASNRDVDIKCQASGTIKELPYTDVSVEVKPGAVVCVLDPVDMQRLLDTASAVVKADEARLTEAQLNWNMAKLALQTTRQRNEAALASAQARASDARAKAERTRQLYESKLASKEDLETAQTAAAQADAELQNANAAIAELEQQKIGIDAKEQSIKEMEQALSQDRSREKTAQQNKDYCTVFAPKAADPEDPPRWFISSLLTNIAPGYVVQSGTSGFSAGTTIMTLSDLSHIYVLASVDESDIGQITDPTRGGAPQMARVTVDAYPNVEFDGKVVRVATKGVNSSNVVTFEVKIEVTSANRTLLRPEMTANVKIITDSRSNVLTIPVAAFTPKGRDDDAATRPAGDAATRPASDEQSAADQADRPTTRRTADAGDTAAAGAEGRGRGGRRGAGAGGGRGRGRRGLVDPLAMMSRPQDGTVTVVKDNGENEVRNITVGLSSDDAYEVISGLNEDETVVLNRAGAASRWRNPGQGRLVPRGMGR